MEPTSVVNAAVSSRGENLDAASRSRLGHSSSNSGLSLAALVDLWARAGASVPVAIIGSIFDDVLASDALADLRCEGGSLKFDDVIIDANGVARIADVSRASVEAIAVLVVRALGEDPPASALPVIARFSTEGARDAAELRAWVRAALGAIATHDEVASMVSPAMIPADEHSGDLSLTQPTPLGIASAAIDFASADERENATEIIRPRSLPSFPVTFAPAPIEEELEIPILSAIPEPMPEPLPETQMPHRIEPSDAPAPPPTPPVQVDTRPVIRHQLNKPNVQVHSAPAARRSGKRVADPRDSLMIPDDRPHWGAWLFVILLLGIGALFWLRYL